MSQHTIAHYAAQAQAYAQLYDSLDATAVHAEWLPLLATMTPGAALDVGAGSGRDARWLASRGWHVTAVEPASPLRMLAAQQASPMITWLDDSLPALAKVPTPANGYPLILLSAVWMHIPPAQRASALTRLAQLLAPDGKIIISLRFGPSDPARPMYKVSLAELSALCQPLQLQVTEATTTAQQDQLQRPDVYWKTAIISPVVG